MSQAPQLSSACARMQERVEIELTQCIEPFTGSTTRVGLDFGQELSGGFIATMRFEKAQYEFFDSNKISSPECNKIPHRIAHYQAIFITDLGIALNLDNRHQIDPILETGHFERGLLVGRDLQTPNSL